MIWKVLFTLVFAAVFGMSGDVQSGGPYSYTWTATSTLPGAVSCNRPVPMEVAVSDTATPGRFLLTLNRRETISETESGQERIVRFETTHPLQPVVELRVHVK